MDLKPAEERFEDAPSSGDFDAAPDTTAVSPAEAERRRRMIEDEAVPLMDLVYAVARRMVGEDARAEDLVQETYLRAFKAAGQYRPGTNCKAWLLTILRSACIDSSRQALARGGSHEPLPTDIHARLEKGEVPLKADEFMDVLDVMVDDDVRKAMLAMQEMYREAFVMVVIAEMPYREAAELLGVQEGTVKSRVFRACQTLKSRLWHYATERRFGAGGGKAADHGAEEGSMGAG